jgi:NADH-quinone oxidoreductase subunit L
VGVLTAAITSLYSFRLAYLLFAGDFRGEELPHELPKLMIWSLPLLALLGLAGGLLNLPHLFGGHSWLSSWLGRENDLLQIPLQSEYLLLVVAAAVFLLGWLIAHFRYRKFVVRQSGAGKGFFLSGWRCDACFDRLLIRPFRKLCYFCWQGGDLGLIDGLVEGFARACLQWGHAIRFLADGKISRYLQGFAWGLLLIVGWFLLQAVR